MPYTIKLPPTSRGQQSGGESVGGSPLSEKPVTAVTNDFMPERSAPRPLDSPLISQEVQARRRNPGLNGAHTQCVGEVFRRAQAFRQQIAEWRASGRWAIPVLVMPDAPEPRSGFCVSCGAMLTTAKNWRCATCLEAVHIALALATTGEQE